MLLGRFVQMLYVSDSDIMTVNGFGSLGVSVIPGPFNPIMSADLDELDNVDERDGWGLRTDFVQIRLKDLRFVVENAILWRGPGPM